MVVSRLFEHIRSLSSLAPYEEEVRARKEEKERQLRSLKASIAQIPLQQENLAKQLSKTDNEQVQRLFLKQTISLRSLDIELQDLEQNWEDYPFAKRQALLNFLVEKVVITFCSVRWMQIEVHWFHKEWGIEQCYYCRKNSSTIQWSDEEKALLRRTYPGEPCEALLHLFPRRSWHALRRQASNEHIIRTIQEERDPNTLDMTLEDLQFMEQAGILPGDEGQTKWIHLSRHIRRRWASRRR